MSKNARTGADTRWTHEQLEWIEERACIMEFDGGLTREQALACAREAVRKVSNDGWARDAEGNAWLL